MTAAAVAFAATYGALWFLDRVHTRRASQSSSRSDSSGHRNRTP